MIIKTVLNKKYDFKIHIDYSLSLIIDEKKMSSKNSTPRFLIRVFDKSVQVKCVNFSWLTSKSTPTDLHLNWSWGDTHNGRHCENNTMLVNHRGPELVILETKKILPSQLIFEIHLCRIS